MVCLWWHCTEIPFVASEKHFSVFLIFISAVDLFVGIVVCTAEALMRLRCAFGDNPPTEGDFPIIVEYIRVNRLILLVTSMSVDRSFLLFVLISISLKSNQNTSSSAT